MKERGFLVVLMACFLAGCDSHNYNWTDGILIVGYTGYDEVSRAVKKHVYAAPGARLDDFENRIKAIEHQTSLDSDFDLKTNGVWLFNYEGKETVYYGRFVKVEGAAPRYSAAFEVGEIKDPVALAMKLRAASDLVSADLFGRFSEDGRRAIGGYPQSGLDAKALQGVLAKELNAVIAGSLIYDEHRFGGVTLRPVITNWLKVQPRSPREAAWLQAGLNRFLLEDVYPHELAAAQRVDYRHGFVAIKY